MKSRREKRRQKIKMEMKSLDKATLTDVWVEVQLFDGKQKVQGF